MTIIKTLASCIILGFLIAVFIVSGALIVVNYELLIVMGFLSTIVFGLAYSLFIVIRFIYEKVIVKC